MRRYDNSSSSLIAAFRPRGSKPSLIQLVRFGALTARHPDGIEKPSPRLAGMESERNIPPRRERISEVAGLAGDNNRG